MFGPIRVRSELLGRAWDQPGPGLGLGQGSPEAGHFAKELCRRGVASGQAVATRAAFSLEQLLLCSVKLLLGASAGSHGTGEGDATQADDAGAEQTGGDAPVEDKIADETPIAEAEAAAGARTSRNTAAT